MYAFLRISDILRVAHLSYASISSHKLFASFFMWHHEANMLLHVTIVSTANTLTGSATINHTNIMQTISAFQCSISNRWKEHVACRRTTPAENHCESWLRQAINIIGAVFLYHHHQPPTAVCKLQNNTHTQEVYPRNFLYTISPVAHTNVVYMYQPRRRQAERLWSQNILPDSFVSPFTAREWHKSNPHTTSAFFRSCSELL